MAEEKKWWEGLINLETGRLNPPKNTVSQGKVNPWGANQERINLSNIRQVAGEVGQGISQGIAKIGQNVSNFASSVRPGITNFLKPIIAPLTGAASKNYFENVEKDFKKNNTTMRGNVVATGNNTSNNAVPTDAERDANDTDMFNAEGGATGGATGGSGGGSTVTTDKPFTPLFSAEQMLKTRTSLANDLKAYQDLVATNASDEQKRALADKIRKTERSYQQALQQISEQDFMQQRALMQGAQARGLGGSGLEQLGRTQARMQTGQQLNQLSQQYGDQLQGYLNTQLGIEEKLATALAGNALTQMGNINEAEIEALNLQWTQEQQRWSREDRAKFDTDQGAAHYLDLFTKLKEAGDNAQDRDALKEAYSKLLPPATIEKLFGMTGPVGSGAAGDVVGKVQQTGDRYSVPTSASEKADYNAAMAQDEGDGRLSMLKVGNTKRYFPNDDALILHVKNLYANRENSDKIRIVVSSSFFGGSGVRYVTPDGKEFDTYNKASNAIG